MITVYGRATSVNVQAVMWTIAELGLACRRLDFGHVHGGLDTPEFRAMNPHGLVPVLRDNGIVIWESAAILRYLAARYGAAPFWPADPALRAPVDMWAEWGKSTFGHDFLGPIFWTVLRTPPSERNAPELAAALIRFGGHLALLERQIGTGSYVLGADLTLADIAIGRILFRYYTLEIPRGERPVIAAYYARLTDRPAFREHVMVSFEPLRAGPT